MIDKLIAVLSEIKYRTGSNFAGSGIIVCDEHGDLPLFPIRLLENARPCLPLIDDLADISSMQSEYHDGFHVVTSDFQLVAISQYFSPPIVENLVIDRTKRFGGRYLAALFGSTLPLVKAIGIASNGFGLAIFSEGKEIYFRSNL